MIPSEIGAGAAIETELFPWLCDEATIQDSLEVMPDVLEGITMSLSRFNAMTSAHVDGMWTLWVSAARRHC